MNAAGSNWLAERLLVLIPLVLSLSVHEWAHAYAAYRLGDDTAEKLGRLTLNPLAHIDPVGTFLLPLLGVPFGWAKPVPFNPLRLTTRIRADFGMLIIAAAGPVSNFALAVICTLIAMLIAPTRISAPADLLRMLILINVVLGVFNLLPVPPLDGSKILDGIMPRPLRPIWDRFCSMGAAPLIALIIVLNFTQAGSLFNWLGNLASALEQAGGLR